MPPSTTAAVYTRRYGGGSRFRYDVLMRFFAASFLFLSSVAGFAQAPPVLPIRPFVPEQVKTYLGLSDEQVLKIQALNTSLSQFQAAKAGRQIQVRVEISQEIRKESLDPMAVGLRYVELEVIRRELEREQQKTVAAVQALLNEPQKAKVAALVQVMRDYPTACAGVGANVVPPLTASPVGRVAISPEPIAGFLLGIPASRGLPSTCGNAIPTSLIRTGGFTAEQP